MHNHRSFCNLTSETIVTNSTDPRNDFRTIFCDTSLFLNGSNCNAPHGVGYGDAARLGRRLHAPPDRQQHVGLDPLSGRLLGHQLGDCHSRVGTDPRGRTAFLRNNWWLFCRVSQFCLVSKKEGLMLEGILLLCLEKGGKKSTP